MTTSLAVPDKVEDGDQKETIAFLRQPASYPGHVGSVKVVETHAAMVFLTERDAFKIKKAVTFSYLDFGTLEKRKAACDHELKISQPHAPQIYLDVVKITRDVTGQLAINGAGETVEWALHMRRFPDGSLLADRVRAGDLKPEFPDCLADEIARYHAMASVVCEHDASGRISAIVNQLCAAFAEAEGILPLVEVGRFKNSATAVLQRCSYLLSCRGKQGYVRRCHGDLHLANIVVLDNQPVLFDAIEFNDEMATVDVLYDLAFLLMDLAHCGEDAHANRILNRYLSGSGNVDHLAGLLAMPLFMACRAGVRAMVAVTRLQQSPDAHLRSEKVADANAYLLEATGYLAPQHPRLIAIGGLSGTGKTSVARALAVRIARCPGAVHLRTDVERKQMFGVDETARLPRETYTRDASDAVYERVLHKATVALRAGHSVITDAVFLDEGERTAIEKVAEDTGASFAGVWLEAQYAVLIDRVSARQGDASDATADVVRQQLRRQAQPANWHRINADGSLEDTVKRSSTAICT